MYFKMTFMITDCNFKFPLLFWYDILTEYTNLQFVSDALFQIFIAVIPERLKKNLEIYLHS